MGGKGACGRGCEWGDRGVGVNGGTGACGCEWGDRGVWVWV